MTLTERVVEVHRRPAAGRYGEVERVDVSGQLAPVAFPAFESRLPESFLDFQKASKTPEQSRGGY